MAWIIGDNHCLIPQRSSGGLVQAYVNLKVPESWLEENVRLSDPEEAKQDVLKLFQAWRPDLLDTIRYAQSDSIVARKLCAMPIGFQWPHKKGVTIIGDAA